MTPSHADLYQRLRAFRFDEPGAELTFADRLARANNWSVEYANRAIEEYRRYAFLAVTAGHVVTPSEDVDQVWHLHLTYTTSYWDDFCQGVLGRSLHHIPTLGGAAEERKRHTQYEQTLASYRAAFGSAPPGDLWPEAGIRFGAGDAYRRVNTHDYLLVPRETVQTWDTRRTLLLAACVGGVLTVVQELQPLDRRGPEFLVLFVLLFALAYGLAWYTRLRLRHPDDHRSGLARSLPPCEKAYLIGGVGSAINAALAWLTVHGAIGVTTRGRFRRENGCPPTSDPLPHAVHGAISAFEATSVRSVYRDREVQSEVNALDTKLAERGLLVRNPCAAWAVIVPLFLSLSVPVLGLVKIDVGLLRGKPVVILIALCIVMIVVSLVSFLRRPFRSRRGDRAVQHLRHEHAETRWAAAQPLAEPDVVALGVGLFGPAVLAGEPYAALRSGLAPAGTSSGGGSSSTGCGGGGCGGGGCGGGGCGGCGGG